MVNVTIWKRSSIGNTLCKTKIVFEKSKAIDQVMILERRNKLFPTTNQSVKQILARKHS